MDTHTTWISHIKERIHKIIVALAQSEKTPIVTYANGGHKSNGWHLSNGYLIRGAVCVESHHELVFIKQLMEGHPDGNVESWMRVTKRDGLWMLLWVSERPPRSPPSLDTQTIMRSLDMFIENIWKKPWQFQRTSGDDGYCRILFNDDVYSYWYDMFWDYCKAFAPVMQVDTDVSIGDPKREITVYFQPDSECTQQFFPSDVLVRFLSSG